MAKFDRLYHNRPSLRLPTICYRKFLLRVSTFTRDMDESQCPESRFLPTPSAFDAPVKEIPVGILPCRLVWKN